MQLQVKNSMSSWFGTQQHSLEVSTELLGRAIVFGSMIMAAALLLSNETGQAVLRNHKRSLLFALFILYNVCFKTDGSEMASLVFILYPLLMLPKLLFKLFLRQLGIKVGYDFFGELDEEIRAAIRVATRVEHMWFGELPLS